MCRPAMDAVVAVAIEIVVSAPEERYRRHRLTNGKGGDDIMDDAEEAEAVEGQIWPWLLWSRGENERRVERGG
jgi:hypothetical protein